MGLLDGRRGRTLKDTVRQCRTCPWRVDCDPGADIPNGYSRDLHAALSGTIAKEGEVRLDEIRAMACHYSEPGREFYCAGWLHNQLGVGNNIGLRIQQIRDRVPVPIVEGAQHERFEDTLPPADAGR